MSVDGIPIGEPSDGARRDATPPSTMRRDYVRIFDTTLRDGEQAPGCTLTPELKREVARTLARLGVDVIEAGFPAASPGDWDAVYAIGEDAAQWNAAPVICALARATPGDIKAAATALALAPRKRIHTFLATSNVHLEFKLRLTRAEVMKRVQSMVRMACDFANDVEFSAEDASRSDPIFLRDVLYTAIDSGATTINIPDTVGYTTPGEYGALIAGIQRDVVGTRPVVISAHCHDDLGLAVANSLAAIQAGARQIECTMNGLGERAGNAALEELVMALRTRADYYGVQTGINISEIGSASRVVARATGVRVSPNKAIVGANAFAHEAGIHQDGMLKHRATYAIMDAEELGLDGVRLVLGKHSGRHALRRHLETRGIALNETEMEAVFARFKTVADRKKQIDDRELEAIVASETHRATSGFALELVQVSCGTHAIPTATVRLADATGREYVAAAQGDGPVDAVCRAINHCVERDDELVEYTVDAAAEGINAVGSVMVRLRERALPGEAALETNLLAAGYGVHTDIIVATAQAYLSAVNSLMRSRARLMEAVNV